MNIDKALQIDGWMSPADLKWLAETASNSELILEIGCYKGRSTRAMADNTHGIIYAVDPWVKVYYKDNSEPLSYHFDVFEEFQENLKDHIYTHRVLPIREYSENIRPRFTFDFTFIDGDHRYNYVKQDIEIALKYTIPGGIIAGHDYTHGDWPGVKKAVDETFPRINLVDSIWWTNELTNRNSNR